MRASLLAIPAVFAILTVPTLAEGNSKVVQEIRHVDSTHTDIVIKDYRPKTRQAHHPAEPTFKEYDLSPVTSAPRMTQSYVPPARTAATVPGAVQTYNQSYSPGPNTGMAANGFVSGGSSTILSPGPIYGYGYGGYGYGGYGYGGLGYPGYGYGYGGYVGGFVPGRTYYPGIYSPMATYSNAYAINQPAQRYAPPGGVYPAIPQSFVYPGYVTPGGFQPVGCWGRRR